MIAPVRSRSVRRTLHLLLAAALGTYLYSPLSGVSAAAALVEVVVFPGLALSGLWLWKGPVVRRWYRTRRTEGDR